MAFFKLNNMEPCEVPFITCDNKELSAEQLFRALLADINGQPAVRTCGAGGGGGGGITELPIGNVVYVNTLGNDGTASRQRFDLPFSSIDAAVSAAVSGDTIIVLPGNYNAFQLLHKEGVKWSFIGNPNINLYGNAYWSDNLGATEIFIEGSANVRAFHFNPIIKVVNVGTRINASFRNLNALRLTITLTNGSGVINVEEDIDCTLNSVTIAFYAASNYVINAKNIINSSTTGSVSAAVFGLGFTGYNIVNANIVDQAHPSGVSGTAIQTFNSTASGTLVVNVTDSVKYSSLVAHNFNNKCVFHMSGNLIINGNINGGVCPAINIDYNSHVKTFKHNGNAENDGTFPLVVHSVGNSIVELNGKYKTSNKDVVLLTGTNKTILNGEIENSHNALVDKTGVKQTATNTLLLRLLKIVFSNVDAQSFGLFGTAPSNVKIIHGVSSNADVNLNITNLITGTNYVFDTDIE